MNTHTHTHAHTRTHHLLFLPLPRLLRVRQHSTLLLQTTPASLHLREVRLCVDVCVRTTFVLHVFRLNAGICEMRVSVYVSVPFSVCLRVYSHL